MSDPHEAILEQYFFTFIDRGVAPEETPIFTGIHEGEKPLRHRCLAVSAFAARGGGRH
jgi:hypothetical protein